MRYSSSTSCLRRFLRKIQIPPASPIMARTPTTAPAATPALIGFESGVDVGFSELGVAEVWEVLDGPITKTEGGLVTGTLDRVISTHSKNLSFVYVMCWRRTSTILSPTPCPDRLRDRSGRRRSILLIDCRLLGIASATGILYPDMGCRTAIRSKTTARLLAQRIFDLELVVG